MLLLKDECGICKRIVSSSFLRRGYICGQRYCFDCITFTKEGDIICLNCARRIVSPRKLGTKYSPLSRYLLRRAMFTGRATLPFAKIEAIISDNLPISALRDPPWWGNGVSSAQGRSWTNVGWKVKIVDLLNRRVTFYRVASPSVATKKRRRGASQKQPIRKFAFSVRRRKLSPPSKTKIAKVQARLKNIQRARSTMQLGLVKAPHPAYEKRLYKPDAR